MVNMNDLSDYSGIILGRIIGSERDLSSHPGRLGKGEKYGLGTRLTQIDQKNNKTCKTSCMCSILWCCLKE